jgi:hypothetical protein
MVDVGPSVNGFGMPTTVDAMIIKFQLPWR